MPIIHIETNLVATNSYEFVQTFVVGDINVNERVYTETHEDRMYASMTNLGYACKWLSDEKVVRGDVCIVTDTDGKDVRYNGEHDDLFNAIKSQHDYDKNRAKYALIYGRYVKFLDRIRHLANANEIGFTQNAKALLEISHEGREFVDADTFRPDSPFLIKNRKWDRNNIIQISMSKNTVTCRACQKSIKFEQTDRFTPIRGKDGNGRSYTVKTNKQLVKNFQETHLGLHKNKEK